jgi:histidine kinase/DNA gyrase B/HSP90-like ATPase
MTYASGAVERRDIRHVFVIGHCARTSHTLRAMTHRPGAPAFRFLRVFVRRVGAQLGPPEAMTNSVRHAKAKRISVRLSFRSQTVRLSVRDDGVGFTVNRGFEGYGAHWGPLKGPSRR